VSIEGDSITFRRTLVFVCNGKEQLEMPAGSIGQSEAPTVASRPLPGSHCAPSAPRLPD